MKHVGAIHKAYEAATIQAEEILYYINDYSTGGISFGRLHVILNYVHWNNLVVTGCTLTDEVCWVVVQGAVQANTAEVVHHCICRTTVSHLHRGKQGDV